MIPTVAQTTVSSKWQIVLPKKVRALLEGIKPGQKAWVEPVDRDQLLISFKDPIEEGLGLAKGKTSLTKALLEERKRDREREERKIARFVRS